MKKQKCTNKTRVDDLANCVLTLHQIVGESLTMSDSTFLNSGLVLMQPSSAKPVVGPEIEQDSALSPILAHEISCFLSLALSTSTGDQPGLALAWPQSHTFTMEQRRSGQMQPRQTP